MDNNDIYAGFENPVALLDYDDSPSYQNALKISSYGKKTTTPSSVRVRILF